MFWTRRSLPRLVSQIYRQDKTTDEFLHVSPIQPLEDGDEDADAKDIHDTLFIVLNRIELYGDFSVISGASSEKNGELNKYLQ